MMMHEIISRLNDIKSERYIPPRFKVDITATVVVIPKRYLWTCHDYAYYVNSKRNKISILWNHQLLAESRDPEKTCWSTEIITSLKTLKVFAGSLKQKFAKNFPFVPTPKVRKASGDFPAGKGVQK